MTIVQDRPPAAAGHTPTKRYGPRQARPLFDGLRVT